MVVDPSEAKSVGSDEETPDTWRGRVGRWLRRFLPVKY